MKRIIQIIKQLAPNVCSALIWVLLKHPLLIFPTIKATIHSITKSAKHYPDGTGKGVGNAYKHALWNILLAKYVRWRYSEEKALNWAKRITDLHEECIVNAEMDRLMDLHNNKIGRQLYELASKNNQNSLEEMENLLKEKANNCAIVKNRSLFKNYPYDLVYVL